MDRIIIRIPFTAGQTIGRVFSRGIDPTGLLTSEYFTYGGADVDQAMKSFTIINRTAGDIRFHTENDPTNAINLVTANEKVHTLAKDGAWKLGVAELRRIRIYAEAAGTVEINAFDAYDESPDINPSGANVSIDGGTGGGGVPVGDASQVSDTGALRTAAPKLVFQHKFNTPDLGIYQWVQEFTGTASAVVKATNEPYITMTGGTANGYAYRVTRRHFNWRDGLYGRFGTCFNGDSANVVHRVGFGNELGGGEGIWIEYAEGGVVSIKTTSRRTGSPVDTTYAHASWEDMLDGSGASGVTIDLGQTLEWFIDFGWKDRIRIGIILNGTEITAKTIDYSNAVAGVPFANQNFPALYETEVSGAASLVYLFHVSTSVYVNDEGYGWERAVDVGITGLAATTTLQEVVSIQSQYRNATIKAMGFTAHCSTLTNVEQVRYLLLMNASRGAGTTTAVDDSAAQKLTGGGTVTFSGSDPKTAILASVYARAGERVHFPLTTPEQLGFGFNGDEIITLAAQMVSGTGTVVGSISFKEEG